MAKRKTNDELDLGLEAEEKPAAAPYIVSARKYRPQTFRDLVGQDTVARALSKAITEDRVPHALLFSGPRGVGKTSAARILAKALNCAKGPTPDPCGQCFHCVGITNGSDMDVVEIDGASNTGVDNIRELRERVNYMAFSAPWKVYIIDEVHMLSQAAFNALLKTLEEPPPRVIFVFATTEPEKVPETIRSRCSWFQFGRIDTGAIVARLEHVVSNEKDIRIVPEERREVLHAIATGSEGGLRDALVTLDQLVALCDGSITLADTRRLLGLVEHGLLIGLLQGLLDRQTKQLLERVNELAAAGQDFERLAKSFCQFLRDVMIVKTAGKGSGLVDMTGERLEALASLAARASHEQLLQFTRAFLDLEAEMKTAAQPRILLEYTLVKLTAIDPVSPLDQLLKRLEALEKSETASATPSRGKAAPVAAPGVAPAAPGVAPARPRFDDWAPLEPEPSPPTLPVGGVLDADAHTFSPVFRDPAPVPAKTAIPAAQPGEPPDLPSLWNAFMSALRLRSHALSRALEGCAPLRLEGKNLTVALRNDEQFLYNRSAIERDVSQGLMSRILREICGRDVRIVIAPAPIPPAQTVARPRETSAGAPERTAGIAANQRSPRGEESPMPQTQAPARAAANAAVNAPANAPPADSFSGIGALAGADLAKARRAAETPKQKLERLVKEDPAFAKALEMVTGAFNGFVTQIDRQPLR